MTRIFAHTGVLSTRIPMPKYMQAYFYSLEYETFLDDEGKYVPILRIERRESVFLSDSKTDNIVNVTVTFSFNSEQPFVYFTSDVCNVSDICLHLKCRYVDIQKVFSSQCTKLMRNYRNTYK